MGPMVMLEVAKLAHPACIMRSVLVDSLSGHFVLLTLAKVTFLAHSFGIVLGISMGTVRDNVSVLS